MRRKRERSSGTIPGDLELIGVVDKKFTLERVINERVLKQAQHELKSEGRLRP